MLTLAYIGPGAGFAFFSSFFMLLSALFLVLVTLLTWPFRAVVTRLFRKRPPGKRLAKRVIMVGLDGLDPRHARRLMDAGRLPNLKKLADEGTFSKLESTCPPISPVAWSSFMTGSNPGKHNIFDFLNRNLKTYLPELSSSRVVTEGRKPVVLNFRKSKPFWHVLGEYGVFSTVLRVPITFPPEKFGGLCLAAMCIPDLRGTQGTFTYFASEKNRASPDEGGLCIAVERRGNRIETALPGPLDLKLPLVADIVSPVSARLQIDGQRIRLEAGTFSPWIRLRFKKVSAICRFLLIGAEPEFRLYVTPLQVDPERPALPISHPPFYSIYFSKLIGRFATLGLAEDTWALNEGVLTEDTFLDQAYSIHKEREDMFLEAVRRTRNGFCGCVFDGPDRIQHMFFRHFEPDHPANDGKDIQRHKGTIDDMYVKMDELVGRVAKEIGPDDLFMVISDHGFTSFKRGVNLNAWLKREGYLFADASGDFLRGVDWSRTRAYSFGLSGIYINKEGREAEGIVSGTKIAKEIAVKLRGLTDEGRVAISEAYLADESYSGPYADAGPDIIVGYNDGYRASWEGAIGRVDGEIFTDNVKFWSGDHCVDYKLVPGVFFCNRKLSEKDPRLIDLAPTILHTFGIEKPAYMDGRVLPMS